MASRNNSYGSVLLQLWPILVVFSLTAGLFVFERDLPPRLPHFVALLLVSTYVFWKYGNQILFMPWGKLVTGALPPGPPTYPILGILPEFVKGDPVQFRAWCKRYGSVWKALIVGDPIVFVCGTSEKRTVLLNEGGAFEVNFPRSVETLLGDNSVSMSKGVAHRTVRTILSRHINFNSLQKLMPSVEDAVIAFVDELLQKGTVAAYGEFKALTFGIICQLSLSLPDGPVRRELEKQFTIYNQGLFTFIPMDLPWTGFGKAVKARRRMVEILDVLIMKRREELAERGHNTEPRDVLDTLITHKAEESDGMTFRNNAIQDLIINLLFAGHETSSSFIAWLLLCLKEHPGSLKAMRKEHDDIAATKSPGERLTWADYKSMEYTQKFINEVQRMHATVPAISRKVVREVKLGKFTIPKGWKVLVLSSTGNFEPENFSDPDTFNPDRFDSTQKPFTFNPFGGGVRICPGMELSRMEICIFLHHFTRMCDWEQLEKQAPVVYFPSPLPGKGYVMKVSPRVS